MDVHDFRHVTPMYEVALAEARGLDDTTLETLAAQPVHDDASWAGRAAATEELSRRARIADAA